jgi:hypothetical protein
LNDLRLKPKIVHGSADFFLIEQHFDKFPVEVLLGLIVVVFAEGIA